MQSFNCSSSPKNIKFFSLRKCCIIWSCFFLFLELGMDILSYVQGLLLALLKEQRGTYVVLRIELGLQQASALSLHPLLYYLKLNFCLANFIFFLIQKGIKLQIHLSVSQCFFSSLLWLNLQLYTCKACTQLLNHIPSPMLVSFS